MLFVRGDGVILVSYLTGKKGSSCVRSISLLQEPAISKAWVHLRTFMIQLTDGFLLTIHLLTIFVFVTHQIARSRRRQELRN